MDRRNVLKTVTALYVAALPSLNAISKVIPDEIALKLGNYDLDAFAGENVFTDSDGTFVLTDHQWLQIQAYIAHALSLPTTAFEFQQEFQIPTDIDIEGFRWLMDCYTDLKGDAESWNNVTFPKLITSVDAMSGWCSYSSQIMQVIYMYIEELKYAAEINNSILFENNKTPLLLLLNQLLDFAIPRAEEADQLRGEMITFQNHLARKNIELDTLEHQYDDLIGRYDGDSIKEHIEQLRVEIDQLNKEYARLVTIAATTPTYAWVPFWGWFIAPAIAGVYGAQAAEVNRQREERLHELHALETSLDHGKKIFRSWKLARQSIHSTHELIGPATNSLGLLIGQWQLFETSLSSVIKSIEDLDSNLGKDNIIAAILAKFTAEKLEKNWLALSQKCDQFIESITIETYH